MEVTLYSQTITFLSSLILGGIVVGIYIFMEVMREASPPNKIILFMEDMIFSFIVCGLNLFFSIACTQGYIRWYVVTAQMIVFVSVYFTLGKLLKKIVRSVFDFILFCNEKTKGFLQRIFVGNSQKMIKKKKKIKK